MTAKEIIEKLDLEPLLPEGGYYKETFHSSSYIKMDDWNINKERKLYTTIYYLLTPDTFSEIHRLPGDEVFHFYLGDPVEMLQLDEDGNGQIISIGNDIMNGIEPQILVKGGTWQGCRLKEGGKFALMGTTMSPGFDYDDYESGKREQLIKTYPDYIEMINQYF